MRRAVLEEVEAVVVELQVGVVVGVVGSGACDTRGDAVLVLYGACAPRLAAAKVLVRRLVKEVVVADKFGYLNVFEETCVVAGEI